MLKIERVKNDLPQVLPKAGKSQEMVILMGPPASGKSTMAKSVLKNYTWINRDTLKTASKCAKEAKKAVSEGKSVVIDNTSPSKKVRAPYIAIAKSAGIKV